jgi:hypothetical protein
MLMMTVAAVRTAMLVSTDPSSCAAGRALDLAHQRIAAHLV